MKVAITKLEGGSVKLDFGDMTEFVSATTNVRVSSFEAGSDSFVNIKIPDRDLIQIPLSDLESINGEVPTGTLEEIGELLITTVFKTGGGNGGGVAGEPITDASLLISGTLPDARLSSRIKRSAAVTTATALNFDFPSSVVELEITGTMPTDISDARTATNVVLTFYKDSDVLFICKGVISIQGQSSVNAPKKGYAVDFFNASNKALLIKWGKCHPVDGVNFKGFFTDPTHTRDVSAGRLWHKIRTSRPFPSSFIADFVNDQLSTNTKFLYYDDALFYPEGFPMHVRVDGQPFGLYTWRMKKKRENYRLDSKNKAHIFLDSDTNTGLNFSQFNYTQWDLKSPKLDGYVTAGPIVDTTVLDAINGFFNWMGGCISGSINMRTTYTDHLNLDSFIDILITAELIHSVDLNNNNTELMTWDAQRFSICIYDQDLTLGFDGVAAGAHSEPNQQVLTAPMWAKIKEVFGPEIKTRYTELRTTGVITMNGLKDIYSAIPSIIPTDYYIENLDKWGWPGQNVEGQKWNTSLRDILDFLQKKLTYLDGIYWSTGGGNNGGGNPPTGEPATAGLLTASGITGIDISLAPEKYSAAQKTGADNISLLVFADYLPADTDGYIELCMNSDVDGVPYDSRGVYFGFAETTQLINPANMTLNIKVGIFPDKQGAPKLLIKDNDAFYDANVGTDAVAAARGNAGALSNRVRVMRAGNVFSVLHSGNFGVSYVTLYTCQNYNYTGKLYVIAGLIDGGFGGGSELVLPKGSGLFI